MRRRKLTRLYGSLLAAIFAIFIVEPTNAQDVAATGTRIELTGRLTAEQRDFVLRLPQMLVLYDRVMLIGALVRQRVYWGEFDLDGDGAPERIIMFGYSAMIWDGSDCTKADCDTLIMKREAQGWVYASKISAKRNSMHVLPEIDRGWRRIYGGPRLVYERGPFGGYVRLGTVFARTHEETPAKPEDIDKPADLPEVPPGGVRLEFTNRLTAAQRNFVRTHPEFQWMYREIQESIFKRNVYWAEFDLNDDGVAERLVLVEHGGVCGTAGCNLTVLRRQGGEWVMDSGLSGSRNYFVVLPETDDGWHRLDDGSEILTHFHCGYYSPSTIEEATEDGINPCRKD